MVTIPEDGDLVMLGFEYGDPSRPYVIGSLFSEKTGAGGGDGNKTKSITTRSGSTVTLDDDKGSAELKDKHGSDSTVALDGEGNITLTSKESINFICGQSRISIDKDGNISVNGTKVYISGTEEVNAGAGAGGEDSPASGMSFTPESVSIGATQTTEIAAGETISIGSKTINICAEEGNVVVQGTKINLN
jgi:uncharacterized protein involved in type VI secretion and phage assembly